ncbi:centrosomal protein of 89 kDa isoform X2 [Pseudophryne corroboree]|uniref:centrosomal protein of 89 kDa isoform X2 n=1 Tax=Pseudophryne corroboree TaxID=495146 RepID=UPI003081762A
MSFPFRRRDANQFKHIAHGLIPAATVAPRSAVPRTPPPRSPNPSPERPRSALAAAILMTSLTGRIVAIPQPRQRSYSENDSTRVEEAERIEPYATARDLGLEENWKAYATRGNVSSPVMSFEYEDDDTEEHMSDIEREHTKQLPEWKAERSSNDPIYAVPHRGRTKIRAATRTEEEDGSGTSSPEGDSRPAASQHLPTEESSADGGTESPIPRPGPESVRKQAVEMVTSGLPETLKPSSFEIKQDEDGHLRAANLQLTSQNRELSGQVEAMREKIKSMRVKLKNLKSEKKELAEICRTSQGEAQAAELFSLREQAQELVDDNDALNMTIHRLNVELSRYQTKYRPLSKEENVKIGGLPSRGPPPPWLLDMKYLSPLLLAYEDRIKEKDNLIVTFEEEIKNFKVRVNEIIEENENLHQLLAQDRPVTNKEWELLQAQSKLLIEENQVQSQQLEVLNGKSREAHAEHLQEVTQLTKQLMTLEATKRSQEEELLESREQRELLRSKCSELKVNMESRVAAEEHVAMVNELKSRLRQQQEDNASEVRDLMAKISVLQAEKKALLLQRIDLSEDNKVLEAEVEKVKKSNRKMQRRLGQLKQQLEDAMEKEVAAHQYLANLITLAESTAWERDQLIHMAKGLEAERHGALAKMMEGSVRLGRLEETVKVYKKKAASAVRGITHRLTEQEEDFVGEAARYQREMKHLHWLLRDRQESLDDVLQQKRQVEGELEVIWESTSNENKQLKALLHSALKQNKPAVSDSPVQRGDSVVLCDFSYCNVNSSPRGEDPV